MKILKLTQNDKKVQFDDSFEAQITYEDMVIRCLKEFHLITIVMGLYIITCHIQFFCTRN